MPRRNTSSLEKRNETLFACSNIIYVSTYCRGQWESRNLISILPILWMFASRHANTLVIMDKTLWLDPYQSDYEPQYSPILNWSERKSGPSWGNCVNSIGSGFSFVSQGNVASYPEWDLFHLSRILLLSNLEVENTTNNPHSSPSNLKTFTRY